MYVTLVDLFFHELFFTEAPSKEINLYLHTHTHTQQDTHHSHVHVEQHMHI